MADVPNRRVLSNDDILFSEGDAADCAYIIESGELEISTESEGAKVVICELGAGDIVGEMGVIDSSPRTATATARGETSLIMVTRDALTERIAQADPILKLLVKILLDRYRTGLSSVKGDQRLLAHSDLISADVVGEYVRHGIDKIRLEAELKDALNDGQLVVLYQPMLDVQNQVVAGFEALTRWHHPTRGPISPGLFISLAEETNLIVPVGLYVFERACSDLAEFSGVRSDPDVVPFMSINVSARQIADPEFIQSAAKITDRLGLKRSRIKLEITEGLAVEFNATKQWMAQAKEMGFLVSLDDFGTGFSSLETLAKLPLDSAKIDQAFIRDIDSDRRARELFRGIVTIMRGLGLDTVAEGIETPEQLAFIRALDCHLAQGYLIGKPMPYADAKAILKDGPAFLKGS